MISLHITFIAHDIHFLNSNEDGLFERSGINQTLLQELLMPRKARKKSATDIQSDDIQENKWKNMGKDC